MVEFRAAAVAVGFAVVGVGIVTGLAVHTIGGSSEQPAAPRVSAPTYPAPSYPAPAVEEAAAPVALTRQIGPTPIAIPTLAESLRPPAPRPTPAPTLTASSTPTPTPQVDRSGRFTPVPVDGDIYDVDFHNGFTYPLMNTGPVDLVDGVGSGTRKHGQLVELKVDSVIYHDVVGDGNDDAVVVATQLHDGRRLQLVRLFSVEQRTLVDWGTAWRGISGDTDGYSESRVTPERGSIVVESVDDSGQWAATETWVPDGSRYLRQLDRFERRRVDLGMHDNDEPVVLPSYLLGQGTVILAEGNEQSLISFEVEGGQMLNVVADEGAAPVALRVWSSPSGRYVGQAESGSALALGHAGTYVAQVQSDTDVEFDVEVATQRQLLAPTWKTRAAEQRDDESDGAIFASWPEFTSSAGAAQIERANETVLSFVQDRLDQYLAGRSRACKETVSCSFDLNSHVALVSYDLVSVEFTEYSVLGISDSHYDVHTLTIDLNTGERVPVEETIVASDAEVGERWLAAVRSSEPYFPDVVDSEVVVTVSALSLYSQGLVVNGEVAVDGETVYWSRPMIAYDQLDSIMDSKLAMRASSGVAGIYPQADGCGC